MSLRQWPRPRRSRQNSATASPRCCARSRPLAAAVVAMLRTRLAAQDAATNTKPGQHETGSIGQARPATVEHLVREIHASIDGDDWLRLSRAKVRKVAKAAMRHPDPYAAANALL